MLNPPPRPGVGLRYTILALAGLVASFAASPAAVAQDPDAADLTTVDGFAAAWVDAVRSYDVDRWAELVTPDVVMMSPDGRVLEGRQPFHALWSRTFAGQTGVNPLQVSVLESRVEGDMAVVRAAYGPQDAAPVGQYVWILERDAEQRWSMDWWIFNRKPESAVY